MTQQNQPQCVQGSFCGILRLFVAKKSMYTMMDCNWLCNIHFTSGNTKECLYKSETFFI